MRSPCRPFSWQVSCSCPRAWPTDAFGTPRPDAYFQAQEAKAPVVSQRYEGKDQLDLRLK